MNLTLKILCKKRLQWMETQHQALGSLQREQNALGIFQRWCQGRGISDVIEVTLEALQSYHRWVSRQHSSASKAWSIGYQHQLLDSVHRLFAWALGQYLIIYNPASKLERLRPLDRLPVSVLSVEEIEEVLKQPNLGKPDGLRDRAMLEVLYACALRRQETLNLKMSDIDHERRLVWVRQGKGRKDRVVPISRRALSWINRYCKEVRSLFLSKGKGSEHLFLNKYGSPLVGQLKVPFYIKQAIPDKSGSCHLIRHSVATILLERGCDIRLIQEFLGHESLNSTQTYTRVRPQDLKVMIHQFHPSVH